MSLEEAWWSRGSNSRRKEMYSSRPGLLYFHASSTTCQMQSTWRLCQSQVQWSPHELAVRSTSKPRPGPCDRIQVAMKSVQPVAVTQFPCLLKRRMIPVPSRPQHNCVNKQNFKNKYPVLAALLHRCLVNILISPINDVELSVEACKALSKRAFLLMLARALKRFLDGSVSCRF